MLVVLPEPAVLDYQDVLVLDDGRHVGKGLQAVIDFIVKNGGLRIVQERQTA